MKAFLGLSLLVATVIALTTPSTLLAQLAPEMQRLKSAEMMVAVGRCAEAIPTLRELSVLYPQNAQVKAALKNAFICNKDFDSALVLLDRLVRQTGEPTIRFGYYLDITGIYLRQGDTKKAEQQLQVALASNPNNQQIYEQAANMYLSNGYYADAVRVLLDGRKKFGNPLLYGRNLGQVYEVMRNYGDAVHEYFQLLANDTTAELLVTGNISRLIKLDSDDDFDTGLKVALADIVKQNPRSKYAQRYFGDLLVSQGKLEEAFQRFRTVDSLEAGNGKEILYFAKIAHDNGDQTMVEKACSFLITRYPQSPFKIASRFALAQSYSDGRRYSEAIALYQQIADESKSDRDVSEALFEMGYTKLVGMHDPPGALELFNRLMNRFPQMVGSAVASIMAADCHLALGEDQIADSLYKMVSLQRLPLNYLEELLFKQAELQFYRGDFQAARDAYGKMMNTYPKSIYVNDCLRRIMLISEYPGMDEVTLRIFSDAVFARFRFNYDSALVLLDNLKQRQTGMLSEISWYEAGEIQLEIGRTQPALIDYDSLIALYPESFYAPMALERKGDVYADIDRDCAGAKTTYESVLLKYPSSLNLEEVRKKLQHVERFLCARSDKPKS
jgi:tetratricopeptide (TPR) repeat protein